ncbi:hypothetical protein SLE2022_353230 [Rubroshorea leprosula]
MAAIKATTIVLIAAVFVLMLSGGAKGQAPAPEPSSALGPSAPGSDCLTTVLNMSDCLSYVTTGSNATKPDKACCPELAGLVESAPICLCDLLDKNKTESYGISIDMSRALKLPSVCGVPTPPVSLCSVIAGVPVGSPTASPGSAPEGLSSSPSAAGSNGVSSNVQVSALASFLALAIAFLHSFIGI